MALKGLIRRSSYLAVLIVLIIGILTTWPGLIKHAGATEVTIDSTNNSGTYNNWSVSPKVVFTSDQTGYVFYTDANDTCVYSKTTNGGSTWGAAVTVDSQNDCARPVVWYDQWTPGDDTGTNIYILTEDTGSDDLWYNRLDTSSDTLAQGTSPIAVSGASGANKINTFVLTPQNFNSITKGTDGDLYVAVEDSGGSDESYALKCTTSCDTVSNWTTSGSGSWTTGDSAFYSLQILPLAGGDIMAIHLNTSSDDLEYQTYDDGTNAWSNGSSAWVDIDTDVAAAFRATWSATLDKVTNDIYVTATDNENGVEGGNDDDVHAYKYSSGSFSSLTDVVTNDSGKGLVSAQIAFNENNMDLYVGYTEEQTAGDNTTLNAYYKVSTDGGSTWGAASSALNSAQDTLHGPLMNMMSNERIYMAWNADDGSSDQLRGETMADLVPPTYDPSGYRWFNNINSTDVGTSFSAANTAGTIPTDTRVFRLRMLLHVGGDGARVSLDDLKLQFAAKSGSCDTSYSGETYADVTTTSDIAYFGNPSPSDGASLTGNANDPTHSSDTIRNQTYEEANDFTNPSSALDNGEDGKWDFALQNLSAPDNTSYCFRVRHTDGTATVTTPTLVPELATPVCASATVDEAMRHGEFFCAETNRGLSF